MKKVLSMVLAATLVVGGSAVAFGAGDKLDASGIQIGKSGEIGTKSDSKDLSPDDNKYWIALKKTDGTSLKKADVNKSKLGVQIRASEGSSVIKSASITYDDKGDARIELKFVDEFVSTKEQDYSLKIYPTFNKTRAKEIEFTLDGSFANASQEVSEGDDFVNLADVPVVEAKDYIKNIEVDLGQGVSIFTKMFEGKKYYGKVSQDIKAEDEAILAKYPDIDTAYYLKTINLNGTGDTVKFNVSNNMYAYVQDEDGNLVFLGRTNDRLPYYTKYFLSTKELDVEEVTDPGTEAPEIEGPGEEPTAPGGDTGGDDTTPNVNDNPGTGR